jgi:shikimate dehydrogenase
MNTLYGLIGEKLTHSISPLIHSIIMESTNINGFYHLFEVEKAHLETVIIGLKNLNAKGINVTIPYKQAVMPYLDGLSSEAERIGAVNTIRFENNTCIGYNTDYFGLHYTFERLEVTVSNKRAVILGSGGVAVTVLQYLIDNRVKEIYIASRDVEKLRRDRRFNSYNLISYDTLKNLDYSNLLINCTPCGMYPNINDCAVDRETVSKSEAIIDLIYNPKETLLLRYASELGVKNINGLYMLVAQAIQAQKIWNNIECNEEQINMIYEEVKEKFR